MSKPVFVMSLENKNISLFTPQKDAFDICTAYETGNLSLENKEVHDQMKHKARLEKENDKLSMDEVFTMDWICSRFYFVQSQMSSSYYKTKLIVHNFTLYDLKRKIGYCFLWNETEGGLTANEFSSIIVHFLHKYLIDSFDLLKNKKSK